MTTAVSKDEEAFQNANKSAAAELQRIGFNPPETMKTLKVEIERESTGAHHIHYEAAERSISRADGVGIQVIDFTGTLSRPQIRNASAQTIMN